MEEREGREKGKRERELMFKSLHRRTKLMTMIIVDKSVDKSVTNTTSTTSLIETVRSIWFGLLDLDSIDWQQPDNFEIIKPKWSTDMCP